MGQFVRKNLVVDAESVRELASRRGASEAAAREAVDHALAAKEVMAAIRELHNRDGVDDVFDRVSPRSG